MGVVEALAEEEQLDLEGLARLLHLAAAEHAEGLLVLGADRVLATLTAVGGDGDAAHAHAARQQGDLAGALVVGVGADGHEAGDGTQGGERFVQLDDAALALLLDDARVGAALRRGHAYEDGQQQRYQRPEDRGTTLDLCSHRNVCLHIALG